MIKIRRETPFDLARRETLLDQAFGEARFGKTAERLRESRMPAPGLSFVACADHRLVGTVRLWNVSAGPDRPALLLGPLAVDCEYRSQGIGADLMRLALDEAARRGHGSILLVGDAPYYGRFGFSAEKTGALWLPGAYERDRLLARELTEGALDGAHGLVNATGRIGRARKPRAELAAIAAGADGSARPLQSYAA